MAQQHGPRRDQRGSSAPATVLLLPLLLLLILTILQVAIWAYGRNATLAAAQAAADADRVINPVSSGRDRALQITQRAGLSDVQVSVFSSATTVTATVTARSAEFIPVGLSTHTRTVVMPRERVTRP